MAVRAEELSTRPGEGSGRRAAWWPVLALFLAAGCTALDPFVGGGPPVGPVHQVVATWNNEVVFAADTAHGGAPTPGLAGRLYLFGPEIGTPLGGDGSVFVDLYDESGDKPVMLEEIQVDPASLQRLQRQDMIGWGYTLFLPWGTYKPEIKRVGLKLCYQPGKGSPLYAERTKITLHADSPDGGAPAAAAAPRPQTAAELAAKAAAPAANADGVQVSRFQLTR